MTTSLSICVIAFKGDHQQQDKANILAQELHLPIVEDMSESVFQYHLLYTDNCLTLQQNPKLSQYKISPIYVDYLHHGKIIPRLATSSLRNPLAKAMGLKANKRPSIVDATAGMGMDGITLAYLGCKVTLMERSPIIHALLNDGLLRAKMNSALLPIIRDNITLISANSISQLANLSYTPESVLLDPMYPQTSKTALQKKEMRILRDIVGDDFDSEELFTTALEIVESRVVVKRPKGAEHISQSLQPTTQIFMKSGRFDVYLKAHL